MSKILIKTIPTNSNDEITGELSIIDPLPERIYRSYIISNVPPGATRGQHAHKQTRQYLFCPTGQCDVTIDDGEHKTTVRLDRERGLLLADRMVWHSLYNFSDDCVIVVYATEPYDESDYIRNYDEFIEYAKQT